MNRRSFFQGLGLAPLASLFSTPDESPAAVAGVKISKIKMKLNAKTNRVDITIWVINGNVVLSGGTVYPELPPTRLREMQSFVGPRRR